MTPLIAEVMPARWQDPLVLVQTEERMMCQCSPEGTRPSPTRYWPDAVSLRAAERPYLGASAGALAPSDVSERSVWFFSPSFPSYNACRLLGSRLWGDLSGHTPAGILSRDLHARRCSASGRSPPARGVAVSIILAPLKSQAVPQFDLYPATNLTGVPFPLAAAARLLGGDSARFLDRPGIHWFRDTGSNAPDRTLSP
jgi:hypothetical protein